MGMPIGEASKRIRWKAGKEDELWAYMQERLSSGANISEALKAYANRNGISWLTARWKYYRLKQDRLGSAQRQLMETAQPVNEPVPIPEAIPEPICEPVPAKDQTIENLSDFLRSASRLGEVDLAGFLQGLASITRLAVVGEKAKPLEHQLRQWETLMANARKEQESLARFVDEWTAAPGIERITSIADFEARLKAQIGALGRALKAWEAPSSENTAAR